VVRANLGWISLLTLIGGLLGWIVSAVQTPMYQSRTVLDIRSLNENFLNPREGTAMGTTGSVLPESYLQTEIKILQSDSLRKRAVDKIPIPKQPAGELHSGELSFWRSALGLLDPSSIPRKQLLADAAKRVKVRALGNTRIVEIICVARDGQLAADLCNSLAHAYIEYNIEARYLSTKETGDWLQSQLDDVRKRLTKAESELKDSARDEAFLVDGEAENLVQEKLKQLQAELSRSQAERIAKQSGYEIASNDTGVLPLGMDSGPLPDYRVRLTDLKRQLAEASSTMTPEHYHVRELKMQIAELESAITKEKGDLVNRVRAEYDVAKRRESLVSSAYDRQASEASQHGDKAVRYTMLKRDVDTERKLYETLLQKVNEVGLATALRTSTISVVDPAMPSGGPYSPNEMASVSIGLIAGAGLALAFFCLRVRSDRTLRSPGEAPFVLQLRELGVIPAVRSRGLHLLRRGVRSMPSIAALDLPADEAHPQPAVPGSLTKHSPERSIALGTWLRNPPELVEAFSGAMNSLLFASGNGPRSRVIVVTSPDVGDGKTTVSTNLAIALAQIGRRVVIVDGDLRKPKLHQIFGKDAEGGLAKILDGTDKIEGRPVSEFIPETNVKGLFVLPTVPAREGISAKLHSGRMRDLLSRLREEFDVVIIDSPPMLHLSDARVLGWLSDGVLLVFRAGKTTRDAALVSHDCLIQDGTNVLGTILNDWNPAKGSTYKAYSSYLRAAS
jgi:succinoglycan biosynthesis transport protein ExoP